MKHAMNNLCMAQSVIKGLVCRSNSVLSLLVYVIARCDFSEHLKQVQLMLLDQASIQCRELPCHFLRNLCQELIEAVGTATSCASFAGRR